MRVPTGNRCSAGCGDVELQQPHTSGPATGGIFLGPEAHWNQLPFTRVGLLPNSSSAAFDLGSENGNPDHTSKARSTYQAGSSSP